DLTAEQRLLLITAGQFEQLGFSRRRADAQIVDDRFAAVGLAAAIDHAEARNGLQKTEAEILAQRQIEEHAFGVAVVRDKPDAGAAEGARTVAADVRVLDAHLARIAAVDAGGGADEFALALAFDAGKPDDFAGMRHQIDLIESAAAQAFDRKQRWADAFGLGREDLAERTAGDQRDDLA